MTLFQKHRAIIYPQQLLGSESHSDMSPHLSHLALLNQFTSSSHAKEDSTASQAQQTGQPSALPPSRFMPKKYTWYPNLSIVSPRCSRISISPSPKDLNSRSRRGSAALQVASATKGSFTTFAERCPDYTGDGHGLEESKAAAPTKVSVMANKSQSKHVSGARKAALGLGSAVKNVQNRQRRGTLLDIPHFNPSFDQLAESISVGYASKKKVSMVAHPRDPSSRLD